MKAEWIRFWVVLLCLAIAAISWAHTEKKETAEDVKKFIKDASLENGKLIYVSGQNMHNERIPIEGGPHWLYMHGGGCGNCHGENGKGGIYPMMCRIKSPAVTYKSLTEEEHGEEETSHKDEAEEHHEHAPYTISTIRKALEEGVNPAGEKFDDCMPLWKLSDEDFRDLIAYLMELDKTSE